MSLAWRVVVAQGRKRRSFIVDEDPHLQVGEEIVLKDGTDSEWTVVKVETTEIIARIPKAAVQSRTSQEEPNEGAQGGKV
jgi:hypothetical protein